MQPSANMKPRAVTTTSAPRHSAQATLPGTISLPEAITRNPLAQPVFDEFVDHHRQRLAQRQADHVDEWLRGGAVPPSAPSTVMKSGAVSMPRRLISVASWSASRSGRSPS